MWKEQLQNPHVSLQMIKYWEKEKINKLLMNYWWLALRGRHVAGYRLEVKKKVKINDKSKQNLYVLSSTYAKFFVPSPTYLPNRYKVLQECWVTRMLMMVITEWPKYHIYFTCFHFYVLFDLFTLFTSSGLLLSTSVFTFNSFLFSFFNLFFNWRKIAL